MNALEQEWLDRQLTSCAYCYCLCLTEESYFSQLDRIGVKQGERPPFLKNENSNATTQFFQRSKCVDVDFPVAIVCMKDWHGYEPIVIAGLLVHEAVHIWQAHAVAIGSFNDHGDEEEAYAIQRIAQQLMWSFVEQTK